MFDNKSWNHLRETKEQQLSGVVLLALLLCGVLIPQAVQAQSKASGVHAGGQVPAGTSLSPADVAAILPQTVFFRGKTAPVQMRNSGAMRWPDGSLFWAAMVDNSGYASDIQETYQFYLVTEQPATLGGQPLPAGAYGAGVVAGKLIVQDIGGHALISVPTENDAAMQRPRPLQVVTSGPESLKLYLGRRWVSVQLAHGR